MTVLRPALEGETLRAQLTLWLKQLDRPDDPDRAHDCPRILSHDYVVSTLSALLAAVPVAAPTPTYYTRSKAEYDRRVAAGDTNVALLPAEEAPPVAAPVHTLTGRAPLLKISETALEIAERLGSVSGQKFQGLAWPSGQLVLCDVLVELEAQRQAHAPQPAAVPVTPPTPTWEEIRKLPSPIWYESDLAEAGCRWCGKSWEPPMVLPLGQTHPDNGCLFYRMWNVFHEPTLKETP